MSDENQDQAPPPQVEKIEGPCPRCQSEVTYYYPKVDFINGMISSCLVAVHSETRCPKCNLRFATQILGVSGLKYKWIPIPDNDVMLGQDPGEKEPLVVIPGQKGPKGLVKRKDSGLIIPT